MIFNAKIEQKTHRQLFNTKNSEGIPVENSIHYLSWRNISLWHRSYKELAYKNGCKEYIRVPALGVNSDFISSLSDLVINKDQNKLSESLYPPKKRCPNQFIKCPCL